MIGSEDEKTNLFLAPWSEHQKLIHAFTEKGKNCVNYNSTIHARNPISTKLMNNMLSLLNTIIFDHHHKFEKDISRINIYTNSYVINVRLKN